MATPPMRLVAVFDPTTALPSVVCEPPKPAAHTFHRDTKAGARGTALVIMPFDIKAWASRSDLERLRPVDA